MIEKSKEQLALEDRLLNDQILHDKILKLVRERRDLSYRVISNRYPAWRKAEHQHMAYVDVNETDKAGALLYKGPKDIIVPYTYAVLQTRLTYFFFSFVSKNPMVPISGRGPMDDAPAKLMEVIQDYQISETKGAKIIYCFLQDCERYGLGIIKNVWFSDIEKRWVVNRKPVTIMGYQIYERMVKEREEVVSYEGNLPINISPYNFLPDPRVNVADVKRMEFCGHKFVESYNSLLNKESEGEYFGIDEIPYLASKSETRPVDTTEAFSSESDLGRMVNVETTGSEMIGNENTESRDGMKVDAIEMVIRIIPKDHELSSYKYPEEWIFTIANNSRVIQCEPSIYNEFNYYVGESNHDYASPMNFSTVDMINGLQDTLSWLFNSHMANVRKIINDSIIVDPSMIELKDLLSDKPVKIIRLKEDYWGKAGAVRDAYAQLTINDITRGHIQDSQIVMNLIQRVSAATDNIMGMVEEVKRTATETSSTINLATARLKLTSYLYYTMAIRPWFKAMVFNNQGLMTEERYYRITDELAQSLGKDPQEIRNRLFVKPSELYGNFDFDIPALDIPIDKATIAKTWKEIIGDVVASPVLSSKFDIAPMFKQMVYALGVNNMKEFEIGTKVLPDAKVEQMAKDGSIAPIDQAMPVGNNMIEEAMSRINGNMQ